MEIFTLKHRILKDEGYEIYSKSFKVDAWDYFKIEEKKGTNFKTVTLKNKVSILYDKKQQSDMHAYVNDFLVDVYGNYSAIKEIYFNGFIGSQRLGDTLPLDYGLQLD